MNDHFVTVGEKLVENLMRNNPITYNNDYKCYLNTAIKESLFINPVTEHELLLLIRNLNSNKSPGPDNIAPGLIKIAAPALIEPLLHIYNQSLMTGIVPDKLKIAKVIPVFKKGDHYVASNYRPISLLSIFDKILEKLMYTTLYSFLTKNNVLYKYQFGFRRNHSTALALIEVLDNIYRKLDENETVLGIYLDLQKAFDTVNHEILLYKLHYYGICGIGYNWFINYIDNRQQFTSVDQVHSNLAEIKCGVQQGSVLGPLLF